MENNQKVTGTPEELQTALQAMEGAKAEAIRFKYGKGGQVYSLLPILLDRTVNPFLDTHFPQKAGKIPTNTLEQWAKENGTLSIIPIQGGNWTYYTLVLLPAKQTTIKGWDLDWSDNGTEFLKYNRAEEWKAGKQVKAGEMVILNITTNRGKAINQGKALGKHFGWDFSKLEDTAKGNSYQFTNGRESLQEIGKNSGKPQGKEFKNIGEITKATPVKWQGWEDMVKQYK